MLNPLIEGFTNESLIPTYYNKTVGNNQQIVDKATMDWNGVSYLKYISAYSRNFTA